MPPCRRTCSALRGSSYTGEDEGREHTYRIYQRKYLLPSLDLIEEAFVQWRSEAEGKAVRRFTEEIRSKHYYMPESELHWMKATA